MKSNRTWKVDQRGIQDPCAARGAGCGAGARRAALLCVAMGSVIMTAAPASVRAQGLQRELMEQIGIDQRIDATIPMGLIFRDEAGRERRLADYFGRRPVILAPVYYECPMLCNEVLNGLIRSLRSISSLDAGDDFDVLAFSFDPREGPDLAARKKQTYVARYDRSGTRGGWHFLTGEEEAIRTLTETVGFRYAFNPETQEYVHAGAVIVVTPEGRVARYFFGIEYPARDLRLSLVEASSNRIGSPVDQLLLMCYRYDPTTGRYGLAIMQVIRLAGLATVLALVSFMVVMFRRDIRTAWVRGGLARPARHEEGRGDHVE